MEEFAIEVTSGSLSSATQRIDAEVVGTKLYITGLGGVGAGTAASGGYAPDNVNATLADKATEAWATVDAGEVFGLRVEIRDEDNVLDAGEDAAEALSVQLVSGTGEPSGATLSGTATVNAENGVAVFTDLIVDVKSSEFEQLIRGLFQREEIYLIIYGGLLGGVIGGLQLLVVNWLEVSG